MKSSFSFHPLFIILVLIFMTSCRAPQDLVYKDFQNLKIEKLGFASSKLKMDLLYYNPNNFGLQLKRTDLDIFIDGTFMGHVLQEYQVSVPKRSDFSLPIEMDVDMKNVFSNTLNSLLNKEVTVKATGSVKLGKMNVYKSFPVNYESKQKISLF